MASVQGLECVCPVDAAPVYQFAESLKDQNKTFEDARGDLHNARTTITSSMTSRATDSLIDELDRQIARIDETVTHRQTLIDATMTFHDEIVTCKARFSNIIFQALCNGLTVDDNTIIDPALSGTSQSGAASLSPSYEVAREAAYHAYSDFSAAEETYRQAWERTKPNNWSASPGRGIDALKFKGWAAQGSRYLSRAAVVGAVVDGGIAAWTQWEADCNGAGRESRASYHIRYVVGWWSARRCSSWRKVWGISRQFHCESHWYRRWWCCRWNRRRINWVRPRAVGS